MHVVGLVYDGVVSREVLGPMAVFDAYGAVCELQSVGGGPRDGFDPYASIETVPLSMRSPDVLLVPGGFGWRQLACTPAVAGWVESVAPAAKVVLAVSTGTLLLDALGLVGDRAVTGHWLSGGSYERSARLSLDDRVVDTGWLVSAAGAASAIHAAHRVIERLRYGREVLRSG